MAQFNVWRDAATLYTTTNDVHIGGHALRREYRTREALAALHEPLVGEGDHLLPVLAKVRPAECIYPHTEDLFEDPRYMLNDQHIMRHVR